MKSAVGVAPPTSLPALLIQFDGEILKYEIGERENDHEFLGKAVENLENSLAHTPIFWGLER